jgi:Serine dehydrogenase proteinase
MGLPERIQLYQQVEKLRGKPLVVYVTSIRQFAEGQIAQDAITELLSQLQTLPRNISDLDLLVVSNGGDGTVAWRIVSLIRERVKKFSILVPHAAFSAATLIALGADEIVMHPHGNLGPTDPQITNQKKGIQFGTEDLQAFLRFAREEVGLTDQAPLRDAFLKFGDEVGFVGIGTAARSTQLSMSIGEKMLLMHMTDTEGRQNARAISEALNTKYFHHGYPLSRSEAKEIGLPLAERDQAIEDLLWSIWKDLETDLRVRETFVPLDILKNDPNCQALFGPVPQLQIPPGAAPTVVQAIAQAYFQQHGLQGVPPAAYETTLALMESIRHASRHRVAGSIFAARLHDLDFKVQLAPEKIGWVDVPLPLPGPGEAPQNVPPEPQVPVPAPIPAPPL